MKRRIALWGVARVVVVLTGTVVVMQGTVAAPITVEAGVALVGSSGLRRYAARTYLTQNETSSIIAPQVRASVPVGDTFTVGAGYSFYATFRGKGVAPTSDVFNEGGIALQVITPFSSSEKIHEFNLDLRYRATLSERWLFEAGPTLSLFHSRAEIWNRTFSANDLRLGGAAEVRCSLDGSWSVGAGYRYAAPPDRRLHIFSVALARDF